MLASAPSSWVCRAGSTDPIRTDGARSRDGTALHALTGLEVHLQDERLTSHEAEQRLAEREPDWRRRKSQIDAVAAAIILQDFLDHRASREAPARRPGWRMKRFVLFASFWRSAGAAGAVVAAEHGSRRPTADSPSAEVFVELPHGRERAGIADRAGRCRRGPRPADVPPRGAPQRRRAPPAGGRVPVRRSGLALRRRRPPRAGRRVHAR